MSFDWYTFGSVLNFTQVASRAKFKTEPNLEQSKLTPWKQVALEDVL
jgi:hypothetical protein